MMTFPLKFLSAIVAASLFLFVDVGDVAKARKSAQADPVQAPPAQAGPAQPAQPAAAPPSWSGPVPDASTCYPLMGMCFSNKVDSALIGTIVITGLTILYNWRRARKKESAARQRYLVALKEEISLNINRLAATILVFPPRPQVCDYLRLDKKNRPLMTFSYYSDIFKNRTEVLQDLPDILIKDIVDFYGKLDSLAINVSGIESKAFETISDVGRESAVLSILEEHKLTRQQGESILTSIALELRPSKRMS